MILAYLSISLAVMVCESQVIAAPNQIDQPSEATAAAVIGTSVSAISLSIFDVLIVASAVVVVGTFFFMGWFRLKGSPRQAFPDVALISIAMFIGYFVLGQVGVSMAAAVCGIDVKAMGGGNSSALSLADQVRLVSGQYLAQAIVVGAFIVMRRRGALPTERPRMGLLKSILIGVATLVLAWPVVLTVASLTAVLSGRPLESIAHETLRELVNNPVDRWVVILSLLVVFVAPALEEFGYRMLLQRALARIGLGPWPAIVLTSLMFALMHARIAPVPALAGLFVLSLALGWAFEKTGRISASIVMHTLFNAANLTAALFLHNAEG